MGWTGRTSQGACLFLSAGGATADQWMMVTSSPHSVLTNFRVRTRGSQGNQMHSVKFGRCNLGFSYTFSESPGSIEYCYVESHRNPISAEIFCRISNRIFGQNRIVSIGTFSVGNRIFGICAEYSVYLPNIRHIQEEIKQMLTKFWPIWVSVGLYCYAFGFLGNCGSLP